MHVLAGIRVWPEPIHIGTYFGWIRPVRELSAHHRLTVVVADLQSLETFPDYRACRYAAQDLKRLLSVRIPQATIILETEQRNFDLYTLQAAHLLNASHFRRLGPFRSVMSGQEDVGLLKALYPAMMVANVLDAGPDEVLAKSGHRSPHVDVINDILARGRVAYRWPAGHLKVRAKDDVQVPDLRGEQHMRRSRPDLCVPADVASVIELESHLRRAWVPGKPGPEGLRSCRVIAPMWRCIEKVSPIEALQACVEGRHDCATCVAKLSVRMYAQLTL